MLYRVSNGFARPRRGSTDRPALDSRFDVQVRQSLPFMDFSTRASGRCCVAVRNFFRDAASDQSVYDELLVVRPPKRVVGGLTLQVLSRSRQPHSSIHNFGIGDPYIWIRRVSCGRR